MAENHALRIREAAEIMGVSVSSVKRYIEAGHFTPLLLPGGHRRIPAEQVDEYFAEASERRRRARSKVGPRPSLSTSERRRPSHKPPRKRRPDLGSPPPVPVYDTSEEALAEIRSKYDKPGGRSAA